MKSFFLSVMVLFCFVSQSHAMLIVSTFDVDNESWTASGAAVSHESTGGNPGGFLRIEDTDDDTFSVFAPSKFKGNLSQFNGGLLSYEIIMLNPSTPLSNIGSGFGRIQLLGGGSNATFDYAPNPSIPSAQFWKTYNVPLTATAWNTTEENWENVLSDVTSVDIILEPNNWSTVGFDNFKVEPVIPEPSTLLLLGLGLSGFVLKKRRSGKAA